MKILVVDDHPLILSALTQLVPALDRPVTMLGATDRDTAYAQPGVHGIGGPRVFPSLIFTRRILLLSAFSWAANAVSHNIRAEIFQETRLLITLEY